MGAMNEEVSLLRNHMSGIRSETRGMREYMNGTIHGKDVTVVFSRWGKVAASSTATTLVERFGIDHLVFTGVAGAIEPELDVGDIVIATSLVQHDMDASLLPGIEKFEIPLLGVSHFTVDNRLAIMAQRAAESYLANDLRADVSADVLKEFQITKPKVVSGIVASSDQFIADAAVAGKLREQLPDLKCVEMEGAAVAQVAYEHSVPCVVIRTISDKADHSAIVDFTQFVTKVASHFTCGSVLRYLAELGNS